MPIIAAKKAKKNLACPSYINPCTPLELKLEELASVLLSKSVKQTALLSKIVAELQAMRVSLGNCIWTRLPSLFWRTLADLCIGVES